MQELFCKDEKMLGSVADQILDFAGDDKIWLFEGAMGAGKTTLIKAICAQLEVEDLVNSPTFSIVNEYQSVQGATIYHFDCYRIESDEEALDIGIEDYFYSDNLCLIEWPSRVENLLPEEHLVVEITVTDHQERIIKLVRHGK